MVFTWFIVVLAFHCFLIELFYVKEVLVDDFILVNNLIIEMFLF